MDWMIQWGSFPVDDIAELSRKHWELRGNYDWCVVSVLAIYCHDRVQLKKLFSDMAFLRSPSL